MRHEQAIELVQDHQEVARPASKSRWRAFISYRRKSPRDRWLAHLLQAKLEKYRTPRRLVRAGARPSVGGVFLDDEELWSGLQLNQTLQEAIASSDYLIVICSPDATPRSDGLGVDYIQQEIQLFRSKPHQEGRVLPVVSAGGIELLKKMNIHEAGDETLAVDLSGWRRRRPSLDRFEFLRLVSPLVGCSYAQLRGRERHRARLRELGRSFVSLVFLATSLVAVFQWREAVTQRDVANARLKDVLAVGRLVFTVADQELKRVHGAAEIRRKLTDAAGDMVGALLSQKEANSDPTVLRVRSLGHTAAGDEIWKTGDAAQAWHEYEAALRLDESLFKLDPQGTERLSDLAVSHGKLAKVLMVAGDLDAMLLHATQAKLFAEEAYQREPSVAYRIAALSTAYSTLGRHAQLVSDWALGRKYFAKRIRLAHRAGRIEPNNEDIAAILPQGFLDAAGLELDAQDPHAALSYARIAIERFMTLRERFPASPVALRGIYIAYLASGRAGAQIGTLEEALADLARARVLSEDQLASQPKDIETRGLLALIEFEIFRTEMQAQLYTAGARALERACSLVVGSNDPRTIPILDACNSKGALPEMRYGIRR